MRFRVVYAKRSTNTLRTHQKQWNGSKRKGRKQKKPAIRALQKPHMPFRNTIANINAVRPACTQTNSDNPEAGIPDLLSILARVLVQQLVTLSS